MDVFEKFIESRQTFMMLKDFDNKFFIKTLELCKNNNDFEKLLNNSEQSLFISFLDNATFRKIWKIFNFKNIEDIISLFKDKKIRTNLSNISKRKLSKIFDLYDIKNTQDYIEKILKSETISYILEAEENEIKTEKESKLLVNYYIQDNFIDGKYNGNSFKRREDIKTFLGKYRENPGENSYLSQQINNSKYSPFSVINQRVDIQIDNEQNNGKKHSCKGQDFFEINQKIDKDPYEVQLNINRFLAPYFPMTRLKKIKNRGEVVVSIDVTNNEDGVNLNKFKDDIPLEILKFFIMFYQFITIDYDRYVGKEIGEKNLGKNFIIYDFDYLLIKKQNLSFFKDIFKQKKQLKEMGEILYTLKNYLLEEIEYQLNYYKSKNQDKTVELLKVIKTRLFMVNMSNILYYHELDEDEDIKERFYQIDKNYYKRNI